MDKKFWKDLTLAVLSDNKSLRRELADVAWERDHITKVSDAMREDINVLKAEINSLCADIGHLNQTGALRQQRLEACVSLLKSMGVHPKFHEEES